jgi:hypothetical protein
MMNKLRDIGYIMGTYKEIIPELQERTPFSSLALP